MRGEKIDGLRPTFVANVEKRGINLGKQKPVIKELGELLMTWN